MKTKRHLLLACMASAIFLAPGLAAAQGSPQHGNSPHASSAGASGSAGGMAMMSVMQEGQRKMSSMQMSGNTDVDFAMMMREHHMSAVSMAEIELRDGQDAKMRDMAKKIIAAQKKEIAQFDAFLSKKGHAMNAPGK